MRFVHSVACATVIALSVAVPAAPAPRSRPSGPAGSGWATDWRVLTHVRTPSCATAGAARVTVMGDSITMQTLSRLSGQLSLAHATSCIDAWSGRPAMPSVAAASALPATTGSAVLVMATGSNDIFDPADVPDAIDAALRFAHGRPIVWLNVYVHRFGGSSVRRAFDLLNSRLINAALAAAAVRHHTLHVVDWYAVAAARESVLLRDGVHVTDAGSRTRTAMTVAAVERALG
jgi:hypothetical protein